MNHSSLFRLSFIQFFVRTFTSMSSSTLQMNGINCVRLYTVPGSTDKRNDVIFCGNRSTKAERNVIFFGGDVQDYSENMLAHRDNKHYEQWNLENTAKIMHLRFPNSHVWVVRASKMQLKTFSVYGNFVESDIGGCPTHSEHYGAWNHLCKLLISAVHQINSIDKCDDLSHGPTQNTCNTETTKEEIFSAYPVLPITLVAFSKGCVVLNQLLYELRSSLKNPDLHSFIQLVTHMYWLDGAHNGGSNTWVTDSELLEALKGTNIEVRAHVTPYQVKDEMRRWVGKEHKKFIQILRKLGVTVFDTLHFANEERSLENHFNVLKLF